VVSVSQGGHGSGVKKGSYAAEIRSMEEGSQRVTNIMSVTHRRSSLGCCRNACSADFRWLLGSVLTIHRLLVCGLCFSPRYIKLVSARRGNMIAGQVLRCAIPYIKKEIPIMIVFRALGFIRDRDILEVTHTYTHPRLQQCGRPRMRTDRSLTLCICLSCFSCPRGSAHRV
jgi:hypothetical protein